MKAMAALLPLLLAGFGCARIYRPITMVPPQSSIHGVGLSGQISLQAWGDNSRYEHWAKESNLRLLVLSLNNDSGVDLEILSLNPPVGAALLAPETATKLVQQQPLTYFILPSLPFLPSLGSSGIGPSPALVFGVVSLLFGTPNALVAAWSNRQLEAFFRKNTWSPGVIRSGQATQGLIYIQYPIPAAPLLLRVIFRGNRGEETLELICPGTTTTSDPKLVQKG